MYRVIDLSNMTIIMYVAADSLLEAIGKVSYMDVQTFYSVE